jgi:catechol 2,3-dioxygenase
MNSDASRAVQSAPMSWTRGEVIKIDHLSVAVPDLQRAVPWYVEVLGLKAVERDHGRAYLATPISGRIAVALVRDNGAGAGLEYASCLVRDADALDRISSKLRKVEIPFSEAKDIRPGAARAIRLTLPTEHGLEFLAEKERVEPNPHKAYPGAFNIEASHVQLRTPDVAALAAFFERIGFRTTDFGKAPRGDLFAAFMRANEFHHQFALFSGRNGLHHIALETDLIDFLKIGDHFARCGVGAEYGPGRHKPGDSLFIYVRDPFGNRIEITSPMQMVGHDVPAQQLTREFPFLVNMWGPQPPESWLNEWAR